MRRALIALTLLGACEVEPPGHGRTALHIHFEGAGAGEVAVWSPGEADQQSCTTDCTLQFPNDLHLRMIGGRVTSLLARFSCESGCTTDEMGVLAVGPFGNDDLEVTVRFTSWEEDPLAFAISGELAPDGDLVIGTKVGVAKVSPTGESRWVLQLASGVNPSDGMVRHVAVAPGGEAYVVAGVRMMKLATDGHVDWMVEAPSVWDTTADGDVVELNGGALRRRRQSDGGIVWSTSINETAYLHAFSLAPAPSGVIYVGAKYETGTAEGHVRRYTSDGALIGPDWVVPADYAVPISVAVDRVGALLVHTNHLMRLDPTTGAVLYDRLMSDYQASDYYPSNNNWRAAGATATVSNQALSWFANPAVGWKGRPVPNGTKLSATSPTGEPTWTDSLPIVPEGSDNTTTPNVVTQGSCNEAGQCALFGPNMPAMIIEVP